MTVRIDPDQLDNVSDVEAFIVLEFHKWMNEQHPSVFDIEDAALRILESLIGWDENDIHETSVLASFMRAMNYVYKDIYEACIARALGTTQRVVSDLSLVGEDMDEPYETLEEGIEQLRMSHREIIEEELDE